MDITVRESVPTVLPRVVIMYTAVSVRLRCIHQLSQVRTYPLWWHSHMCISFDKVHRTGHIREAVPIIQSKASYKLWKLPSCFSPHYFCTGVSSKGILLNMSEFSSRLNLPPIFCVNISIGNQLFNPNLWYKLCHYCSCLKPCDCSEWSEVLRCKWKVFSFSKWFLGAQHLPPSKLQCF